MGSKKINIWKIYSLFYDTLLYFIPYENLVKSTLGQLDIQKGEKILDIGSGTGNLEKLSKQKKCQGNFFCLDFSDSMISIAKKKCEQYDFIKYDLNENKIPFPDGFFDKAVSINAVYTVKDLDKFLIDLGRILKKNGIFVFTTSTEKGFWSVIREHINNLGVKSFLKSILYLPAWIFVIIINVIIDLKFQNSFHSEESLLKVLELSGFEILKREKCYGGLNVLIEARKVF